MTGTQQGASDLPRFDLNDPEVTATVYEQYRRLRASGRVARSERYGGYYMLTRYEDVKAALADADLFTTRQGITMPPFGLPIPSIPLEVDPPEHRAFRKLLTPLFRPKQIEKYGAHITQDVTELIDAFIVRGEADLKGELFEIIPSRMAERLLGLADGEWHTLRSFGPVLRQTSRQELLDENAAAAAGLMSFFREVLERKRREPAEDLISLMLAAEIDGAPMSPDQLLGMAIMVGEAGHATTIRALSSTFLYLGQDATLRWRIIDAPELIPGLIDEMLRLEAPVQMFVRTVTRDCEFAGHPFRVGDKVGMLFGCANRDADAFAGAEQLLVDRRPNNHLSFGVGIHRCVGEPLARMEMRIVIEEVLRRLPDFELRDADHLQWQPGHARELEALPVTFPAGESIGAVAL